MAIGFFFFISCVIAQGSPRVDLGVDRLQAHNFKWLQGKRVGLLTHPAGVNKWGVSTIDVLNNSPQVNLVALFGPEHGIYGDEKANIPVDDRIDSRTGLPVYSLYGKYRMPTAKMLSGLDILVIDLQDIGVRSYTYVSCMRYAMEACFKHGVEVMILDRPNPLGGLKVDGPPLDKKFMSYVGEFQVPYVHGLTIAELALMAKKTPGWMPRISEQEQKNGKLIIMPMRGWNRKMLWNNTGLKWVPTSPAIPNLSAVLGYAMSGLGTQLGGFSHGYGTAFPFRMLTHPKKSSQEIAQTFNALHIRGLEFRDKPYRNPKGESKSGAFVIVKNWEALRPTELSFQMMRLASAWSEKNPFTEAEPNQALLFNKHVGSERWWNEITQQGQYADVEKFVSQWHQQAKQFQAISRQFWLYKN